jgi:hypothetical protein
MSTSSVTTNPYVRSTLETADAATAQAYVYVNEKVVPAVYEGARASREYLNTSALPALQRGWAYLRDVVYPATDAFVRDTAVPGVIHFTNHVLAPAAANTVAYTRHGVVPTAVSYYDHYVNGAPLPAPGSFAVPPSAMSGSTRGGGEATLRPPDGTFGGVVDPSEQQQQPFEQLAQSRPAGGVTNVAAPTDEV